MSAMNFPALIRIFMVLSMTAPSMAAEPYVAWPSKEQLRGIERRLRMFSNQLNRGLQASKATR